MDPVIDHDPPLRLIATSRVIENALLETNTTMIPAPWHHEIEKTVGELHPRLLPTLIGMSQDKMPENL
jgi:hypothetical protein